MSAIAISRNSPVHQLHVAHESTKAQWIRQRHGMHAGRHRNVNQRYTARVHAQFGTYKTNSVVSKIMQMLNNQAHTGIFINADGGAKTLCNRHIDTNQRYIKTSKILDFHHVYTERRDDHGINVVPQWNLLKQLPTIGYIGNVIRTNVIALRLQHIIQRPTNVRVKPSGHRLANQHGNTERLL